MHYGLCFLRMNLIVSESIKVICDRCDAVGAKSKHSYTYGEYYIWRVFGIWVSFLSHYVSELIYEGDLLPSSNTDAYCWDEYINCEWLWYDNNAPAYFFKMDVA